MFWVHASSREDFKNDYRAIALALRLIDSNNYSSDDVVFRLLENWFKISKRWLLVVDNADCYRDFYDPDVKVDDSDTLAKYLPGVEPHYKRVLFTSRDIDLGEQLANAESIVVDRLSDAESSDLLCRNIASGRRRKGKSNNNEIHEEDVRELLAILDYLPLAIIHAASFIKKTHMSVKDYMLKLQKSDDDLISYLEQLGSPTRPNSSSPRSVVRTWLRSFTLVLTKNEKAAHLFCLMACMDRNTILTKHLPPWDEGRTSADDDSEMYLSSVDETGHEVQPDVDLPRREVDRTVALYELEALSLIKRQESGDAFSIHRLVQVVTIHFLRTNERTLGLEKQFNFGLLPFQHSLVNFLLEQINFKDYSSTISDMDFHITSGLLPHAQWLVSQLQVSGIARSVLLRVRLLRRLLNFYSARGDFHTCKETCQLILESPVHRSEYVLLSLWNALHHLGELDKAADILQELRESTLDYQLDDIDLVTITLLASAGKYAAAVQIGRRLAKSIQGPCLYDEKARRSACYNGFLAFCLLRQGAKPDDVEVLKCIENASDGLARSADSPASLAAGKVLAGVLSDTGRYAEAVARVEKDLEHVKARYGSMHGETLACELLLIYVLFKRDVKSLPRGEIPSLDRIRELKSLLEELWHRMKFDSTTEGPYGSIHAQDLAILRAEILHSLHDVLWGEMDKLCDQLGSTGDDETALTNHLKVLKERYKEICSVQESAIKYHTLAIEVITRASGVVHSQIIRLTKRLLKMNMARNLLDEASNCLRDRSEQIVCAVHQGSRINGAMWPKIFKSWISGPYKDNFGCYASIVLACVKTDSALLRADLELGMLYLDQFNKLEDKALLVDIFDTYTINRRPPHDISCDDCGDVCIFLIART